jgi:cytochrome c
MTSDCARSMSGPPRVALLGASGPTVPDRNRQTAHRSRMDSVPCTKLFRRELMRGAIFYLFTAAILAAPVPALTQLLADNNQSPGRQVAMEICSPCHRVFEGQPAPVENVPSFIAIANMPSTTALSLRVFLQSSRHMTRMPNFIISRSDANAVIDYILSLKQQ